MLNISFATVSILKCVFRFVAGVVDLEKAEGFERMLWRAGRGNVYLRIAAIDEELTDPVTVSNYMKNVCVKKLDYSLCLRITPSKKPCLSRSIKASN